MTRAKLAGCALAIVMLVGGFVVWGQALGYAGEGPFTDSTAWTYLGAIVAGLGLALLLAIFGNRDGRR
ncbi:hypothetical protein [Nocardioides sp. AE5]|uniref:hypothetical protein n=1 Tax=Nocardioides sp. AE5 TaxID=2962573 RepID=UPI0028823423|nr:hypothetical protein [Nocardioides sp. AE5]MDT0203534.1 hypothetical protein [Nocardioides sp. AE5]